MTSSPRIMIVDDDPRVRKMLSRYLEDEGLSPIAVGSGADMRAHLARESVDVVLLDLVLPGEDGLSIARDLRAESDVPIIMVTAKGDPIDRVVGLELGADDYITKPFTLREVLARVRAVLRRSSAAAAAPEAKPETEASDSLAFSGWRLDLTRRELTAPEGRLVGLTTGEYDLLVAFAKNADRVLNRDQLMDFVRGREWTPYDRAIDTLIARLRKKIEADPKQPTLIKTVRGAGYVFATSVEQV